jgi:hypothetical protein
MQDLIRYKKIILFLNASSYKVALATGGSEDGFYSGKNYTFGAALNFGIEFFLFKVFLYFKTEHIPSNRFAILFAAPFILHTGIDLLFSKDLKLIKQNYTSYYGKYSYPVYCVFAITGAVFGVCYLFS